MVIIPLCCLPSPAWVIKVFRVCPRLGLLGVAVSKVPRLCCLPISCP